MLFWRRNPLVRLSLKLGRDIFFSNDFSVAITEEVFISLLYDIIEKYAQRLHHSYTRLN